ncbi:hypothetical protein ACHAPT_012402 [Fusarium lateritium]
MVQVPNQVYQPSINLTGAASQETPVSQPPQGGYQSSFEARPVAQAFHEGPQHSPGAIGATAQVMPVMQATHQVPQSSIQARLVRRAAQRASRRSVQARQGRAPRRTHQQTPRSSVNTTRAAPQENPVSQALHEGPQGHSDTHGGGANGIEEPLVIEPSVPETLVEDVTPDKLEASHDKPQPQKAHQQVSGQNVSPDEPLPPFDLTKPATAPSTPAASDTLNPHEYLLRWEIQMAHSLRHAGVLGPYKIGDWLCDIHASSGSFMKVAYHDIAPNGEHFWRYILTGQRVRSVDGNRVNGKAVHFSNGAFAWMENEKGERIVSEWQFNDPGVQGSAQREEKQTNPIHPGLKPGCDPMWF